MGRTRTHAHAGVRGYEAPVARTHVYLKVETPHDVIN